MSKGTTNLSFKYNDSGIRTQKTVNGVTTNYYLNGDKVTLEDNGTDKIYYSYDAAGNLVSMNLNGTEYYYIRNAQGDIIGLFDSAGTQVVGYTYDSWGKLISTDGSLKDTVGAKNPYLYRGYRSDSETGLYYLQSRYYSPEWGRFINADAEGGKVGQLLTHNVFAYCMNNPVNMSDPNGNVA
ncbi:RHS repeat-associated core domain-containing protein [Desulfosporosinus sp. BICA1-9]|uniref:RHS repeat-associated core domain-containing protein n=1 Tax=Desulfosporosinus sp. BICA1-9 TaxID=1531958 RepID=UPI000A528193|nr:RHS repeat-associated core domain-containing protein [Desulfosporosinus sp. BICA1-9]HBW38388.1 RHS repeat-associated core domain-containing protein [Desulfosporosinus sp.]